MDNTSVRQELILFLKKPDYKKNEDLTIIDKFIILFKIFLLTYIGLILVNIPLNILKQLEVIGEVSQKVVLSYEIIKQDLVDYKPYFLITVILIVPIIEEYTFRLPLNNFNSKHLTISFSLFIGIYLGDSLSKLLWMPDSYSLYILIYYSYFILVSIILFSILNIKYIKRQIELIKINWNTKPGLIFYLIASLFAISHIYNLEIKTNDLIFLPLIILPYFVYGLTFGFIRIRLGILYSIIFHIIINGVAFGLNDLIKR